MTKPELGTTQTRTFAIELDRAADTSDGRIPVCLSSELPVRRDFGMEVLDHSARGVDMSYAAEGLPFCDDHDVSTVYGRLENLSLGEDKRLRGVLRPGNHPDAAWVMQDIRDGIRPHVSVGYALLDVMEKTRDGKHDTYRFRWAPYECSTVAVPADITVGIGRSLDDAPIAEGDPAESVPTTTRPQTATNGDRAIMSDTTAASAATGSTPETRTVGNAVEVRMDTSRRDGEVAEMAKLASQHGVSTAEFANALQRGLSRDAFAMEILERKGAAAKPVVGENLDLSPRERRDFSITRIIDAKCRAAEGDREAYKHAGYEREVSEALAKTFGREARGGGFFMPTHWGVGQRVTGQLDVATTTQGGHLKFIEPGSFIELLRNRMMVLKAGAQMLSGLQGDIAFPRQTGAGTFSWAGEAPAATAAVALSHMLFDQLSLSPKTGQSATSISRRLLVQSVVGAEELIRRDIASVHALAIDLAAIAGTGANNQPTGILSTTGIGSVAMGTNGAAATYAKLVDLETAVANANADYGSLAYLTNPSQRGVLKQTQVFASTNGQPVWTGGVEDGEVNGYRAFASKQVPSNLTKGTSTTICSAIIFGNFQELIIGEWGTMEVIVDPYTLADRNLVKIVSVQMVDVGLRHVASFAAIQDAL
jgi:HK97 family phage major capsid protein